MPPSPKERLIAAVRAHQAGYLDIAEAAYRDVLSADPDQPDATHYLGVLAYQQDELDRARELVGRARELKPRDPSIAANLGLVYQALGRQSEAAAEFEAALALEPRQPEAWFNLGLTRLDRQRATDAAECFDRALSLNPGHLQARRQLGVALLAMGQGKDAAAAFEACLTAAPDDPAIRFELGRALETAAELESAAEQYRTIAASDSELRTKALARLSVVLRRQGDLDQALAAAESAVAAGPEDADALRGLGHCLKAAGRLDRAGEVFRRAHAILRDPDADADPGLATFTTTTRAKLRHDAEQMRWLTGQGIDPDRLRAPLAACEQLIAALPRAAADGELLPIPDSADSAGWYNRCLHLADAPRMAAGALNPDLDPGTITADYRRREPGITWIDDFLSAEALASLRRFCLESTIWYDCDHPNGYLGAYLPDGFSAPLLLQIAEELRATLPDIFGQHRLMQLWAYKYDSRLSGIDIHADFAAVNVNFWITPTEANLQPDSGGMVIWDAEAPLEWTSDEYNTYDPAQQDAIRAFLAEHEADEIVIPHRQNRCAIFNSNLLHRTDDIHFTDGYENRRINITMLFGHRGGDG